MIKLFSTLSFEIPKILNKIKIKEIIKTILKLFKENFDKKEVKELKDFSWTSTFFDEKIPRREGSKVTRGGSEEGGRAIASTTDRRF